MHRPLSALVALTVILSVCLSAVCEGQATGRAATAPLSRDWKRIRSEHFTAVGDAGESQLRDALVQLELFRSALASLFPKSDLTSPVPTVLVLFKHPEAMTRFKPRDERGRTRNNVAGYFAQGPHVNRMVTAVIPDRDAMFYVLQHEYTHYALHLTGQDIPTWIDEGLAEFYGTFTMPDRSSGVLGTVPSWRRETLSSGDYSLTFEQLFTAEGVSRTFQTPMQAQRFYSSAWALVHYMVVGDRAGQLPLYLNALTRGLTPPDAFKEAFKVPFSTLESELSAYLGRKRLPGLRVPLAADRAGTTPVERLSEAEALVTQAELLVDNGASDVAEPLLRQALQLDGTHVDARRMLAQALWHRHQWNEAVTTMRALAVDAPKDFAVQYRLATYLSEFGDREGAWRAADAAATLNSASPDAWIALSVSALSLGRTSQANAAMGNAQTIFRDPDWYRVRAHALWETGDYVDVIKDVETYVAQAGWASDRASYAVFLAALSHRKLGEPGKATSFLTRAAPGIGAETWTAVVAQFLRGELSTPSFLDRAKGSGEETEAHAYVGLMASISGNQEEARRHLGWVRDRGARTYSEYGISVAELRRLGR